MERIHLDLQDRTNNLIQTQAAAASANGGGSNRGRHGAAVPFAHPGHTSPRSGPSTDRPRSMNRSQRLRAFTLVELLVVIAIIVVLVALLIPVLGKARTSSQTVGCLSNLRQIMMAFHLYATDNDQRLPDPVATQQSWESLLRPYLQSKEAYHCMADGGLFEN